MSRTNLFRPVSNFTRSDLRVMLSRLTRAQALAALFALESGMAIKDVIGIRWKQVNRMKKTDRLNDILNNIPRHIRTDLVFWEYQGKRLAPLISLQARIEMSAEVSWETLSTLYVNMLDIDFEHDYTDLMRAAKMSLSEVWEM